MDKATNNHINLLAVADNQPVEGVCYLMEGTIIPYGQGKQRFAGKARASDKTFNVVCFSGTLMRDLEAAVGNVCKFEGKRSDYNGNIGMIVEDAYLVTNIDKMNFIRHSNKTVKDLLELFKVVDPKYAQAFRTVVPESYDNILNVTPCAVFHHDAQIGGLMNHKHKGCSLINAMAGIYGLSPDEHGLTLLAYALHDIGKMAEISPDLTYTVEGTKIGHSIIGALLLDRNRDRLKTLLGKDAYSTLVSAVVYHEGEFGVTGKFPPGMIQVIVHSIDKFEADVTSIIEFTRENKVDGQQKIIKYKDKGHIVVE